MDNFEEGRDYEEDQGVGSSDSFVTLEISGLSLFTHHGATEAEQETGQRLSSTSPSTSRTATRR